MDLLRKYCLGPGVNTFEFLSDPDVNFKDCATPSVNFEDPNLRVSLPVFSIHGNHDDPCGKIESLKPPQLSEYIFFQLFKQEKETTVLWICLQLLGSSTILVKSANLIC